MERRVVDLEALRRTAIASTKASAKLEQRIVPPGFVRSPRVEAYLAKRRHSA